MATLLAQPDLSGSVQQRLSFAPSQTPYLVYAASLLGGEGYESFRWAH